MIGDTACRKDIYSVIKSIAEKEIVIVGQYKERTKDIFIGASEGAKKCVAAVNDKELDKCFPGFHTILMDITFYHKSKVIMEIPNSENIKCVQKIFHHCDTSSLASLEYVIYVTFGICIQMFTGNDQHGCHTEDVEKICTISDSKSFKQKFESCLKEHNLKIHFVQKQLSIIQMCIKSSSTHCIFSKWSTFKIIFEFVIQVVRNLDVKKLDVSSEEKDTGYQSIQKCLMQVSLLNLQHCGKKLIAIISTIHSARTGLDEKSLKIISECFVSTLRSCPNSFVVDFLLIIETMTNSFYISNVTGLDDYEHETQPSIRVTSDEIDVCDSINSFFTDEPEKSVEDICLPFQSGSDSSSQMFILQRSCKGSNIEKFLTKIAHCVSEKSEPIGLKNPKDLTVIQISKLVTECLKEKKILLPCRPKQYYNFRKLLSDMFLTIKRFVFTSANDKCFKQFNAVSFTKCIPKLHHYFVPMYHVSSPSKTKENAWACFKKSLDKCSEALVKQLFNTLEMIVGPQAIDSHASESDDRITCEPGDSYWNCEPYSNERSDSSSHESSPERSEENSLYHSLESDSGEDDFETNALNLNFNDSYLFKSEVIQQPMKFCERSDYQMYLLRLLKCQDIKMTVFYYKDIHVCSNNVTEKSFEYLTLCLLEEQNEFPCAINNLKQVKEFLMDLTVLLNNSIRFNQNCPGEKTCSGQVYNLSKCADFIFSLMKYSKEEQPSISIGSLNYLREYQMAYHCVNQSWPNCSPTVSLLILPLIYVPLAIDLHGMLKQKENEMCLSAQLASVTKIECSFEKRKDAIDTVKSCLERVVTKLVNILSRMDISAKKIHWTVDPLSICVTTHPILECWEKDLSLFRTFTSDLFKIIQRYLQEYLNLFKSTSDVKFGEKCINAFSHHHLNRCVSLMFGFMTSYHNGQARDSDYPAQCVEDIFEDCRNMNTFHILMKKSMFIPIDKNSTNNNDPDFSEICLHSHTNEMVLHPCSFDDFENSFLESEDCTKYNNLNYFSSTQSAFQLCSSCILQNIIKVCYYDVKSLKQVAVRALTPVAKCLIKYDINEKCILEVIHDVRNKCILHLHSFFYHYKNEMFMQAADSSKDFQECTTRVVKSCPIYAIRDIFKLYIKLSGLEMNSKFDDGEDIFSDVVL